MCRFELHLFVLNPEAVADVMNACVRKLDAPNEQEEGEGAAEDAGPSAAAEGPGDGNTRNAANTNNKSNKPHASDIWYEV